MILHHGTTRRRAESIVANGPDPRYGEGGNPTPPFGFFMMPPGATDVVGTPAEYARGKAAEYSGEGGPVIVEVDVPDDIARQAQDIPPTFCFDYGFGLEELLRVWPFLPKKVIDVWNAHAALTADPDRLADDWVALLTSADNAVVAVVHELLTRAARGVEVRAALSEDQTAIELRLAPPGERLRLPVPRAGVKFRSMCARLAKLCRKPDGSSSAVYADSGVIPRSAVENLSTLHEPDPVSARGIIPGEPLLQVDYQNDKRHPLAFRISPAPP